MAPHQFYEEEGSKLLTPGAFDFVLDTELKRAQRSQSFVTLVNFEAAREWDGVLVTADDGTVHEVADIIGREVRDTDLIGHTEAGAVTVALIDADFEHSAAVIDRVVSHIEHYEFPSALRIAVGAACYPTHGSDAGALRREAMTRPLVNWRSGVRSNEN
jgi:hypothetical protein